MATTRKRRPQAKAKPAVPPKKRREPCIVAKSGKCPRCGEAKAIILMHSYTGGKRLYRCVSEACKAKSITGKGRQFVVMP